MKVSVRSHNIVCNLTNQCSCPDSVHVLYSSIEFLVAANCRWELKAAKLACSVGKQNFKLTAELKGREHCCYWC